MRVLHLLGGRLLALGVGQGCDKGLLERREVEACIGGCSSYRWRRCDGLDGRCDDCGRRSNYRRRRRNDRSRRCRGRGCDRGDFGLRHNEVRARVGL
jgi:hypothetical protein